MTRIRGPVYLRSIGPAARNSSAIVGVLVVMSDIALRTLPRSVIKHIETVYRVVEQL